MERLVALRPRQLLQMVDGVCRGGSVRRGGPPTTSDFVMREMPPWRVSDRSRPEADRPNSELLLKNTGATFVRAGRTDLQQTRTMSVHIFTIWLLLVVVGDDSLHFKSLILISCTRRGWQIDCPVSRVNTCICSYLLCNLVVMLIVLSCVSAYIHNYLLCDLVIMLIE